MSRDSKVMIAITAVVIALLVGIFVLGGGGSKDTASKTADNSKLVRDNSHKLGSGKVTVVEFGDFQCPACGAAQPNVDKLLQSDRANITFVFRNFPLDTIHKNAIASAKAAEAAAKQGDTNYWHMHDKLYAKQNEWAEVVDPISLFVGYAKEIGLDTGKFEQDMKDQAVLDLIKADQADGTGLGVNATPTFYINGEQASAFNYDTLKGLVDKYNK